MLSHKTDTNDTEGTQQSGDAAKRCGQAMRPSETTGDKGESHEMQTENQTAHQTAMTMEVTRNGANRSGRPSFGRRLDPCNPRSWSGQPLRYSLHARSRCEEREIPEIVYLPADSRLADVDMSNSQVEAVTFKVPRGDDSFFMVLNIDGCVVTVYRKDEAFGASHRRKQRRRELLALAA